MKPTSRWVEGVNLVCALMIYRTSIYGFTNFKTLSSYVHKTYVLGTGVQAVLLLS